MKVELHWVIYVIIMVLLLYGTFKRYPRQGGGYLNFDGIENFFFGCLSVIFTLIWGGIFWW